MKAAFINGYYETANLHIILKKTKNINVSSDGNVLSIFVKVI